MGKERFLTKERKFYKMFFRMATAVALQNLVAYSVNMTDNMMLGAYSQDALSGAAAVNQIFFLVQQIALGIGNALVVMASQYWAKGDVGPIGRLSGIALKTGMFFGCFVLTAGSLFSSEILGLFTSSSQIIKQGILYLGLVRWSFPLFIISNILIALLRSTGTVKISFYVSVLSLILNGGINYLLIFGRYGLPELGVRGAAVGTLTARILELMILAVYLLKRNFKVPLFLKGFFRGNRKLRDKYISTAAPMIAAECLWAVSLPLQTMILGHLSADAIAANSVASTFFQYLKVIVAAMSSASAVIIGNAIGRGNMEDIRSEARTMAVIDLLIGIILGFTLFLFRMPLLSVYRMTENARNLSEHLIIIMSAVMVGMSFQMPVSTGIIQGGGDGCFVMKLNMISNWLIVMPLSFLAAFLWKWPVELVVLMLQSDQFFKGIPVFIKFRSYKWMHSLAEENNC